MDQNFLIKITNPKALRLLQELEELDLIKVLKKSGPSKKKNLAKKYRGIISEKEGNSLKKHVDEMRTEWNDI